MRHMSAGFVANGECARIHKLTMEEAGRNVRRMRFEEVSASLGGAKIALAHHQDDNAETLLLNQRCVNNT